MILRSSQRMPLWLVMLVFTISIASSVLAQSDHLLADIEKLTTLEGPELSAAADSMLNRIKADTAGTITTVLPMLSDTTVSDKMLGMCITVLGMTESPGVVQNICQVAQDKESADIRSRCWTALARIGTDDAGKCLQNSLNYISDKDHRFEVFNALAQMQYAPALPLTLEILKSDAKEEYWRPIFVYGKMGDAAVPYLLDKIGDDDNNVRFNAIDVLGQWLIAPESATPLEEQFWKEKDPIIRNLILSSLEKISVDQESLLAFMNEVKSKGKDKESKDFAVETIGLIKNMSAQIKPIAAMKTDSREQFEHSYQEIWESYGSQGDYQALMTSSTIDDEAALKKLRERILQRNSDESFYDYGKINDIISLNRILSAQK